GTGARGGGAGRAGIAAAGDGGNGTAGSAGFADLPASSSAMIRRMEARISSIEGSSAFAGWLMDSIPVVTLHTAMAEPQNQTNRCVRTLYDSGVQVWQMARCRHPRLVETSCPQITSFGQRPSGVRTPAQLSRTCW